MPSRPSRFAVGDVHGHPQALVAALAAAGLTDDKGHWTGDDATLWFVGDFFDRGPDGVGVCEIVRRLQDEAAAAGGQVGAVLGNHEVLALGMHDHGDQTAPWHDGEQHSFAKSWLANGGQPEDQRRLDDGLLAWLRELPAVARVADDLLLHADTLAYLEWGDDVETINAGVAAALRGDDLAAHWTCWARMTTRFAFTGEDGAQEAERLLGALGGTRIVHGHSPITVLTGTPPDEVTGPHAYADGRALDVDGGLFAGGPCLVVPLDPAAD